MTQTLSHHNLGNSVPPQRNDNTAAALSVRFKCLKPKMWDVMLSQQGSFQYKSKRFFCTILFLIHSDVGMSLGWSNQHRPHWYTNQMWTCLLRLVKWNETSLMADPIKKAMPIANPIDREVWHASKELWIISSLYEWYVWIQIQVATHDSPVSLGILCIYKRHSLPEIWPKNCGIT